MASRPGGKRARTNKVGIFSSIATLVFVVMILLAIGVFAYGKVIENQIEDRRLLLEGQSEKLELGFVNEATKTHDRMEAIENILDGHVQASALFSFLGATTLKSVQFTSFEFTHDEAPTVALGGLAQSFASLALQSDAFRENESVVEVAISDIDLDESGNVTFSAQLILDPTVIQYSNQFSTDTP